MNKPKTIKQLSYADLSAMKIELTIAVLDLEKTEEQELKDKVVKIIGMVADEMSARNLNVLFSENNKPVRKYHVNELSLSDLIALKEQYKATLQYAREENLSETAQWEELHTLVKKEMWYRFQLISEGLKKAMK